MALVSKFRTFFKRKFKKNEAPAAPAASEPTAPAPVTAEPAPVTTESVPEPATMSSEAEFKEYTVKLKEGYTDEDKNAIEESIKRAGGSATWSGLIEAFLVKVPAKPADGSFSTASDYVTSLNESFKDKVEFIEESGTVTTQQ
ncbi:hypothetical protein GGI07_002785 [Coemansia sp. Benny D115]|nr:hypothetical protein GGI07_002785 [Coemansia sp. Benny D115]